MLALNTIAWIGLGSYIFYNTNILNRYLTKPEQERMQAEHEKVPEPRLVAYNKRIDRNSDDNLVSVDGS